MILQNFTFPRAIALLDEIPYPPEKIAFLDLETKAYGRKNSHILYLGLIFLENSTWQVRQWLPEEPEEEKTMLQEVLSLLPCFPVSSIIMETASTSLFSPNAAAP